MVAGPACRAELTQRPRHRPEEEEQVLGGEASCDRRERPGLLCGQVEPVSLPARDGDHEQIPDPLEECDEELLEVEPRRDDAVDDGQRGEAVPAADRIEQAGDDLRVHQPEDLPDGGDIDAAVRSGDALVEQALRVPHGAVGAPADHHDRIAVVLDLLRRADPFELPLQLG